MGPAFPQPPRSWPPASDHPSLMSAWRSTDRLAAAHPEIEVWSPGRSQPAPPAADPGARPGVLVALASRRSRSARWRSSTCCRCWPTARRELAYLRSSRPRLSYAAQRPGSTSPRPAGFLPASSGRRCTTSSRTLGAPQALRVHAAAPRRAAVGRHRPPPLILHAAAQQHVQRLLTSGRDARLHDELAAVWQVTCRRSGNRRFTRSWPPVPSPSHHRLTASSTSLRPTRRSSHRHLGDAYAEAMWTATLRPRSPASPVPGRRRSPGTCGARPAAASRCGRSSRAGCTSGVERPRDSPPRPRGSEPRTRTCPGRRRPCGARPSRIDPAFVEEATVGQLRPGVPEAARLRARRQFAGDRRQEQRTMFAPPRRCVAEVRTRATSCRRRPRRRIRALVRARSRRCCARWWRPAIADAPRGRDRRSLHGTVSSAQTERFRLVEAGAR
jgi:hypothetical protein